ncbi:Ltp family lipoprotein [Frigoribacterium sp. MCBA15_019]|uniref:Ltp family lipoprotein n=1 Tax=unclassified Frigoribacterium TaxID=2627005 RepID=UPI002100DBB5|nr:Ltp family lipoprotein [Frigoribacterium sp. MCBA15_019]
MKKAAGLAIAALVVGIGAFLFGLVPVFGALVGIAAIVLGVLALRKQQSKGMAVTGVVLGAVATIVSVGVTFGLGAALSGASDDAPVAAAVESSAPVEDVATPAPSETTEAVQETQAPEPVAPAVPVEYASALIQAESYSSMLNMSKAGIYDQLVSEYGGQFTPEAAQYAIDTIQADWNANALAKAKSYQETMAMSPEAIRDQLTSEYGEKFTPEEADYAVLNLAS